MGIALECDMGVRDGWHIFLLSYINLSFNDFHLHGWYLEYIAYHLTTDF